MTCKASERARGTHFLESAEGWTSQDMEKKRVGEGHSHPGECRGRTSQDMERKQASEWHSLPGEGMGMD
jgi:hypothetical protein